MEEGGSRGTNDNELRGKVSHGVTRSGSSSLRLRSLSSLGAHSCLVDDDIGSESVSEAGDIGDRALNSNRYSASGSLNFLQAEEDMQLQSFWSRDPAVSHAVSTVTPLPEEIISPLSDNAVVCDEEKNQVSIARIPKFLEYGSCMTHLAVFGILGVLTRYLLQKLFGPGVAGLFLAAYSIIFGIETSKLFRQLLLGTSGSSNGNNWRIDNTERHLLAFAFFLLLLAGLWSMSRILMRQEFNRNSSNTELWLACILGPLGVWIRWFLARLNGRGLGMMGFLKWMPFGTLVANVSAACIMAALATVKKKVNTNTCDIVATGIQFGFLGCLSTVSTFIAEFNAMRESKYPLRGYVYALVTILTSFCLGILIYSVLFGHRKKTFITKHLQA